MASAEAEIAGTENGPRHVVRASDHRECPDEVTDPRRHREKIEPWLSALFQADHLNLLVGSGFTTAIALEADAPVVDMAPQELERPLAVAVEKAAQESAARVGRTQYNIEDEIRSILELIGGLRILAGEPGAGDAEGPFGPSASELLSIWKTELQELLSSLLTKVLATERGIDEALAGAGPPGADALRRLLGGFLLPFGSRSPTRERTHIFTVNYDRLVEYGCDLLGLRIVDRFVGTLAPVFHSSRLGVDLHYNPPGIRGEPRYLEGVVRLTKLHGSVDWRSAFGPSGRLEVQRSALPFGVEDAHPGRPRDLAEQLLIYPNPAKDVETLEFPYAELFRDFAAAVCQPNSVVVTYGYGFGDDHVNRVLRDMLSIPSTHLVIISYDHASGRLPAFLESAGHDAQMTLLIGPHFGDLSTLVEHYLPKPAIDRTTWRMVDLLNRRTLPRNRAPGKGRTRTRCRGDVMTGLIQSIGHRVIGTVEEVSADRISVLLDPDAPQATALNTGVPAGFPRINGYVLIPNEGGATACIVSSVQIRHLPFPKRRGTQQDFGLVDLPFPSRIMALTPIGTLKSEPKGGELSFKVSRGVDVFPTVGDPVQLPTSEQLRAIVEGEDEAQGRILIGHCPTAGRAPVHVDSDKLFGRHLAVLGNTGAGKSCSVAGLVRWSLEAAREARSTEGEARSPTPASSFSIRMASTPRHFATLVFACSG